MSKSTETLTQKIELFNVIKPLVKALSENPLPRPKETFFGVQNINPAEDGGFARTFELAPQILHQASPLLYEKYNELMRDGGFYINLKNINHAVYTKEDPYSYTEEERAKQIKARQLLNKDYTEEDFYKKSPRIDKHISNNPADITTIGHEVAHMVAPPNSFGDALKEVASIASETVVARLLQRNHGIKSNRCIDRLSNLNNFHVKQWKKGYAMLNLVERENIDLADFEQSIMWVSDIFEERNPEYLKQDIYKEIYDKEDMSMLKDVLHKYINGGSRAGTLYYQMGTIFGIILANKVDTGEIILDDIFKVMNNADFGDIEKLKQLGISEITPEMINGIYEHAYELSPELRADSGTSFNTEAVKEK